MAFTITWPTGHITLDIGKFFGGADKKRVRKVLRLAKQYCTEDQREELITEINNEIKSRTAALDRCGELEFEREQVLRPFFGLLNKRPLPPQERALVKQRDRLKRCAETIKNARWDP